MRWEDKGPSTVAKAPGLVEPTLPHRVKTFDVGTLNDAGAAKRPISSPTR